MKELLELIARSLVDQPDSVSVEEFDEEGATVFELRVDPDDMGKVIGRQGRIANALRALLGAAGTKQGRRFILDILE
jgi:predicted RNA-binding protein YlqC (UPF0109 family)